MKVKSIFLLLFFGFLICAYGIGSVVRTANTSVTGVAHELDVVYDSGSRTKPSVEIFLDNTDHGAISATAMKRLSVAAGNHALKFVWSDGTVSKTYSIANSFTVYLSHP